MKKTLILEKHVRDYRRFGYTVQLNKEWGIEDAKLIAMSIASQLREKTKMNWQLRTFGGNKATLATPIIPNREKRRRLKGREVEIEIPDFGGLNEI